MHVVRMCVHGCLCIYACVCIQACMHINYVYMRVQIRVCVHACVCVSVCMCESVCMCVCERGSSNIILSNVFQTTSMEFTMGNILPKIYVNKSFAFTGIL